MIDLRSILAASSSLALGAASAPETRPLFTVKEFPAFQVVVPAETGAWCSSTARVTIRAQSAQQFADNQPVIERIVGGLRAVMSFECWQATTIVVTGKVDGQPYYLASASSAGGWKLENVQLRTAEQVRKLAELETIGRCDRLAAGPGDPASKSTGVSDDQLDAAATVELCTSAVSLDGASPRLRYQLARGLLKQDKFEDAVEQLVPAGKAGHGGALALLGDIYLSGGGGIDPDPATAKALYVRAVQAGFTPAKAVLAKFEDQSRQAAQAIAEEKAEAKSRRVASAPPVRSAARGMNLQGYEYPRIVEGIYKAQYDDLPERGVKIYLINLAEAFRNVCRGSFTINEMNDLRASVIDRSDTTVAAGGTAFFDFLTTMATISQNPGSMVDMAKNAQSASTQPEQASNDAMLFVERTGCGSAAFATYTRNLRSFVKDTSTSANLSAPEYSNACMIGARPTHYAKSDFCMCFVARANSAGLSRGEKKSLLTNFWPAATAIMSKDPQHFGACNGAFAR